MLKKQFKKIKIYSISTAYYSCTVKKIQSLQFFSINSCADSNIFFNGIKDLKIKEELKKVTQDAHDKEIFGAPTFVVNNKIFWGQDRLEFALDEYNKQFILF